MNSDKEMASLYWGLNLNNSKTNVKIDDEIELDHGFTLKEDPSHLLNNSNTMQSNFSKNQLSSLNKLSNINVENGLTPQKYPKSKFFNYRK